MKSALESWKKLDPEAKKLGFVSMLADIASEMLYPITPIFLTTVVGASGSVLGIVEGVAEAINAILQVVSGRWSDRILKRKPFVMGGYILSTLARPITGVAHHWFHIMVARALDRVGKGLRTSPRDAMLGDLSTPENRGITFGWHRGLDTFGAVLGPLISLFLLSYFDIQLRLFYFLALIPGLLSIWIALKIREPQHPERAYPSKSWVWLPWSLWPRKFKVFLLIWGIFSFGNSTDYFLILKTQKSGLALSVTILTYCLYNLTYSLFSPVMGGLSDRIGRKKVLLFGFTLFALVYFGFSQADELWHYILLFGIYGFYSATNEGQSKAYAVDLVPAEFKATGLGLMSATFGVSSLLGGIFSGLVWEKFGPGAPMIVGTITATIAAFAMLSWRE